MSNLNLLSAICLILFVVYIYIMIHKSEKIRNTLLKIQLFIVFGYNIFVIIQFPYKIPVEFSTVSYFLVPLIVLFNIKSLRIWAVYSALLSGLGYYGSMILFGDILYGHFPAYSVFTSLFNHGSLLAYAFINLATMKFKRGESRVIWIGLTINAVWSSLIKPIVLHPGRIFIYEILDANLVRSFSFTNEYLVLFVPIYYVLFVYTLYKSPHMVLYINKILTKRADKIVKRT